jgi:hypothetical protein
MYVPKVEAILLRREGVKLAELSLPKNEHPNHNSAEGSQAGNAVEIIVP